MRWQYLKNLIFKPIPAQLCAISSVAIDVCAQQFLHSSSIHELKYALQYLHAPVWLFNSKLLHFSFIALISNVIASTCLWSL